MSTELKKYGIYNSLQDLLAAVKKNPLTFTLAVVISYLIAGIIMVILLAAMAVFLLGSLGSISSGIDKFIALMIIGLFIYALALAFVYAFTTSCIAFSLSGNKNSLKTTLKKAVLVMPRVLGANALVAVVAYAPFVLLALVSFGSLFSRIDRSSGFDNPVFSFLPILMFAALIWGLIAYVRFALAPFVAMFEPDIPIKDTLGRSRELLKNGGNLFIVKGIVLIFVILIGLILVSEASSLKDVENSDNPIVNLILIIIGVVTEGVLAMLYFRASNNNVEKDIVGGKKSVAGIFFAGIIIIILIGAAAVKAVSSYDDNTLSDALKNEYSITKGAGYDVERKTAINVLAAGLENYYDENGFYPSADTMANPRWAALRNFGGDTETVQSSFYADPNGRYANTPSSDYQYVPSPEGCEKCASYELTARLGSGEQYKKSSYNSSINPKLADSNNQQESVNSTKPAKQAYLEYRISADGKAQLSPASVSIGDAGSIQLTVNLTCAASCNFKLASDNYNFKNTNIYTSSQKIQYTIEKSGQFLVYNQYIPGPKFKISFIN